MPPTTIRDSVLGKSCAGGTPGAAAARRIDGTKSSADRVASALKSARLHVDKFHCLCSAIIIGSHRIHNVDAAYFATDVARSVVSARDRLVRCLQGRLTVYFVEICTADIK